MCLLNVRGFERDEYISRYDRWPMINISSTLLQLPLVWFLWFGSFGLVSIQINTLYEYK